MREFNVPGWKKLRCRKVAGNQRVGDESQVKLSPWFFLGEGGGAVTEKPVETTAEGWGESRIDYLHLIKPASVFQYKVELAAESGSDEESPALHRFFVHYSGPGSAADSVPETANDEQAFRVNVPYRSQLDVEPEALRHIICCPTCVSMVLERLGVDKPTLSICEDVYDARHKIYGVWPKAAQAAFKHGGRAWVDRFRSLGAVREYLETGHPIIASIRVEEGELRGARYPKSSGHLIVITGYNGNDKIRVNDPYSAGPTGGEIEYESADIEKVWLDKGGVAILIEPEMKK